LPVEYANQTVAVACRQSGLWARGISARAMAQPVDYEPLTPQSLADLDGIAFLRSATHTRGAPAWPG
jgi:hypothetical protein